jgi:hypothetical protein
MERASDLESWLIESKRSERFSALALLGSPSAMILLEQERERALAGEIALMMKGDTGDRLQDAFWAAAPLCALMPHHEAKVCRVLRDVLETRACAQSVVGAAYGLLDLDARDVAPQVLARLRSIREDDEPYEEDLASGHLAVILGLWDHRDGLDEIRASYAKAEAYHGDAVSFVSRLRYAAWYLAADQLAARDWIADPGNRTSIAYAAAALADLHAVDALPTLLTARPTIRNPATLAAVDEAVRRLETQRQAPDSAHRMVRLFGRRHESEIALGWESDDIFVASAHAAPKPGEADDSGEDDR